MNLFAYSGSEVQIFALAYQFMGTCRLFIIRMLIFELSEREQVEKNIFDVNFPRIYCKTLQTFKSEYFSVKILNFFTSKLFSR